MEVAIGADLCAVDEAKDFLSSVPEHQPFMATSCCPSWATMAKKLFPQFAPYIFMVLTPMVLTGRFLKKEHPGCKVVFVGPCASEKLEASDPDIRSDVDFVLTFEEFSSILEAKKYDGYLLEGMACPGGCIAGAGVVAPVNKSSTAVQKRVSDTKDTCALTSSYLKYLSLLD